MKEQIKISDQWKNVPKLFSCKNLFVTSAPKERPTPRLLGPLPGRGCGSLHSNSHINPTHTKHRRIKLRYEEGGQGESQSSLGL